MKLYIAAGNHVSNREWALKVESSLQELFNSIDVLEYVHWNNKKELMNLDNEANKLNEKVGDEKDFGVFAKSLGTILILKAIKERKINPKFLILLGIPIHWCNKNNIKVDEYMQDFSCPTLIIQNDKDPTISSQELKTYLKNKGIKNYSFLEYRNSTHDYNNLIEIKNQTEGFMKEFEL